MLYPPASLWVYNGRHGRQPKRTPNPKPPNCVCSTMNLRVTSTEVRTGDSRVSGSERMLDAAAKRYALAGERSGHT